MSLFFFQAEDGIRDIGVTGVQTCALPILVGQLRRGGVQRRLAHGEEVGRAVSDRRAGGDGRPQLPAALLPAAYPEAGGAADRAPAVEEAAGPGGDRRPTRPGPLDGPRGRGPPLAPPAP